MYEMEGPSPGLRGESCPISRALSPLGLHRASQPSEALVARRLSRGITSLRGFPRSSDLSSAAFCLGDVSCSTPGEQAPQGVRPTFSRFSKSPQLCPQNPKGYPQSQEVSSQIVHIEGRGQTQRWDTIGEPGDASQRLLVARGWQGPRREWPTRVRA